MQKARIPGDPPVEVTLRRSARARRYSLRVSGLDGRVTLTLPARGSVDEALDFAHARAGWIRRALEGQGAATPVGIGTQLPFEGRLLAVTASAVRAPRAESAALLVPANATTVGMRVETFLKATARSRLTAASHRHASALGRSLGRITLRDTRSRWGSCSHKGDLMFSWRLVMAPPEVLDYVAAHEVAHLEEMNHSPAFWAVVAHLCPEYRRLRRWLRSEGGALHRYRFGD